MAPRPLNLSVLIPLVVGVALIAGAAVWQRSGIDEVEPRDLQAECDEGKAKSCFELGVRVGTGDEGPRDQKRARTLVGRACELGSEEACEFLPMMKDPETP